MPLKLGHHILSQNILTYSPPRMQKNKIKNKIDRPVVKPRYANFQVTRILFLATCIKNKLKQDKSSACMGVKVSYLFPVLLLQ